MHLQVLRMSHKCPHCQLGQGSSNLTSPSSYNNTNVTITNSPDGVVGNISSISLNDRFKYEQCKMANDFVSIECWDLNNKYGRGSGPALHCSGDKADHDPRCPGYGTPGSGNSPNNPPPNPKDKNLRNICYYGFVGAPNLARIKNS